MVSVLLFALVERFSVSRMQDFFLTEMKITFVFDKLATF